MGKYIESGFHVRGENNPGKEVANLCRVEGTKATEDFEDYIKNNFASEPSCFVQGIDLNGANYFFIASKHHTQGTRLTRTLTIPAIRARSVITNPRVAEIAANMACWWDDDRKEVVYPDMEGGNGLAVYDEKSDTHYVFDIGMSWVMLTTILDGKMGPYKDSLYIGLAADGTLMPENKLPAKKLKWTKAECHKHKAEAY